MTRNIHAEGYHGEDRRNRKWHLEPTVSVGHILTTIALIGTIVAAWFDLDHRVTLNEANSIHLRELIQITEDRAEKDRAELKRAIESIDQKLDRLIEKRN